MQNNKHIDVVGSYIHEIDENNKKIAKRTYPTTQEEIIAYIAKASPLAHPSTCFRKKVFDNGYIYNNNLKTSQDIDLWFRLLANNYKISNIPKYLLLFRRTKDFYKRRSKNKAFKEFLIYWQGIRSLHGTSIKLAFPILRLLFRLMPSVLVKIQYSSFARQILNKDTK